MMEEQPKTAGARAKPWAAALSSLFVYPGVGHVIAGRKRQGLALAVLFSVNLFAVFYQVGGLLNGLGWMVISGAPLPAGQMPSFWVLVLLGLSTMILYLGGALHAALAARGNSGSADPR